jgi:3-hydroxy-9,10-secoandrosta-1,3,5(10)-triene-9,17-dione monooxygenase reductase component
MSQAPSMLLRRALGSFATGVTVVTAQGKAGDVGVTANSFSSVSLEPPMVLWSLKKSSASLGAFTESGAFAVHVLAAHQQPFSDRFARRAADKFEGLAIKRGFGGAPLLEDCAARFQCRLAFQYDGGDHEILVGEIVEFEHSDHPPLVFHGGRYSEINVARGSGDDADDAGALMELVGRAYHWLSRSARQEFARRGLNDEAFYVLRILGREERQSFGHIAQVVAKAGRRLTEDVTQDLERRGLIASTDSGALCITSDGRRALLELTAVRLSAEQAALAHLDRSEITVIKDLLRRLSQ